jgi:hypothetical protein
MSACPTLAADVDIDDDEAVNAAFGGGDEVRAGRLMGGMDEIGVAGRHIDEIGDEGMSEAARQSLGADIGAALEVQHARQRLPQIIERGKQSVDRFGARVGGEFDEDDVTDHGALRMFALQGDGCTLV